VNFHRCHIRSRGGSPALAGFTLVEAIVAISVLGVGIASTVGALTRMNSLAAVSRNATGAYAVLMNQVDMFQSMSPFNPQKTNQDGTPQIPKNTVNAFPMFDMSVTPAGTWRSISVDGVSYNVPVYQYSDPNTGTVVVVNGQLQMQVTDLSASIPNTYQALIKITYTYLGRQYSFSMSTIRTSDI
jgi:type II secretory pathway pseudopilin PulG